MTADLPNKDSSNPKIVTFNIRSSNPPMDDLGISQFDTQ